MRYNQEMESQLGRSTARKSKSSKPTDRRRDFDYGLSGARSNRFKEKVDIQIDDLRDKVLQKENEKNLVQLELQQTQKELKATKEALESLKAKLEANQDEAKGVSQEITEKDKKLEAKEKEIESLLEKETEMKMQLKKLKELNSEMASAVEEERLTYNREVEMVRQLQET